MPRRSTRSVKKSLVFRGREMPGKHALISPSKMGRIGYCPASVLLEKDLPDEPKPYAEEGSRAHEMAELFAASYFFGFGEVKEPDLERLKKVRDEAPEEMHEAVDAYVQHLKAIVRSGDLESDIQRTDFMALEKRIPLTSITTEPDAFGTADCIIVTGGTLHVVDFKYGAWVKVPAEYNPQLALYAVAWLAEYDPDGLDYEVKTVQLHIVQPRKDNICTWEVTREELEARFIPHIRTAAERALHLVAHPEDLRVGAPFRHPEGSFGDFCSLKPAPECAENGEAQIPCQFCKAKAVCPMNLQTAKTAVAEVKEEMPPTVVEQINELPVPDTPEKLGRVVPYLDAIESWCKAVRVLALKRLQVGEEIPGLKLVAGRAGIRKWTDEKEAEKALAGYLKKDEAYELKLISPTKAEKLAKEGTIGERKWNSIQKLITRAEAKPVVALASDPRPAIVPQIQNDFEDLDG